MWPVFRGSKSGQTDSDVAFSGYSGKKQWQTSRHVILAVFTVTGQDSASNRKVSEKRKFGLTTELGSSSREAAIQHIDRSRGKTRFITCQEKCKVSHIFRLSQSAYWVPAFQLFNTPSSFGPVGGSPWCQNGSWANYIGSNSFVAIAYSNILG